MTSNPPLFLFAVREGLTDDFCPSKSHPNDTGWDVKFAPLNGKPLILSPGDWFQIPLGIRTMPPSGWWLDLRPRSSTVAKKHIHALQGVIDEGYEGELHFVGQYLEQNQDKILQLNPGDRIGQLIPVERKEMVPILVSNAELDISFQNRLNKRNGGFGSTGK